MLTTLIIFLSGDPFVKLSKYGLHLLLSAGTQDLAGHPQDDFSMGMMFFLFIGIVFSLICIGVGVVLTVMVILFIVGMISFGLVSSSVVVGVYQKSFLKGLKAFVRLFVMVGALLTGTAGLWTLNEFTHWWTAKSALITGAAIGILSGYILSVLIFYFFRRLYAYLKVRFGDGAIANILKL